MNLIHAIILGLIEGVTEFLPISSTAHLIITSRFFHIPSTDFHKFFEVFIQSGAILSVIILYFNYILKHKNIIKNILISFIPTMITGFILYEIIKKIFFESKLIIAGAMIFFGILFLIIEYFISTKRLILKKKLKEITWQEALIIGLSQAVAVIPGVSRSGVVMIMMMSRGYQRDQSAIYSFLLAVPTIFAASFFDVFKIKSVIFSVSTSDFVYLLIGFFTSFITAYFSVKWLISFLQKRSLIFFGWYRIILGILIIILA